MASFADYDINSLLVTESGRIGPDIYNRTLNQGPWMKFIPQAAWPDELGPQISVMTYERSTPANPLTWSSVAYNPANDTTSPQTGGTNEGTCLPPTQTINFAQTLRTYNLQHSALESPPLCVNDLRFPFQRQKQLGEMYSMLEQNTKRAWEERARNEYFRSCAHKVVARATSLQENTTTNVDPNSYTVTSTLFPNVAANIQLSQSVLDHFAMALMRDGGGANSLSMSQGQPVFGLICSPETSRGLIRDNADLRQDIRWIDGRNKDLLSPLGVNRTYFNFAHLPDFEAPRYDWINGSGYIRRPFYTTTAASYGNKNIVNPDYINAAYEVSFIFHQDVMRFLIPKPISSPGGNTKFDPVSYRGDWKWLNIRDKDRNPDGTIGFFRGILSNGTEPIKPDFGYAIIHQRCPVDWSGTACAAT